MEITIEQLIADPTFVNYCLGTNKQDIIFWTAWRDANSAHQALFEEAKEMVFLLRDQPGTVEFHQERARIEDYIGIHSRISNRIFSIWNYPLSIAATFVILFGATLLCYKLYINLLPKDTSLVWVDQQVPARKSLAITLTDGTKVTLSPSSRFSYPTNFSDTLRQVKLSGSALFDVARQVDRPFEIGTAELKIRVLGTTFKLEAFDEDDYVELALFSGKVAVSTDSMYEEILPGTRLRYSKSDNAIVLSKFDVNQKVDLHQLMFTHASYKEVKQKLSRYYGVVFDAPSTVEMDFSGQFYQEPLSNVLSSLSYATGYHFTIHSDTVLVTKK